MRALGFLAVVAWLLGGPLLGPASAAHARDPRWEFWTDDTTRYTSPWFAGARRIMIPYGCTEAPYYAHDSRCPGDEGFHHGDRKSVV